MARLLFVLPDVDPGADVRLDTAELTDTPSTDVVNALGGVIPGALLAADDSGGLPRVYGPAAGTSALWLKVLVDGEVSGDPVEVTGIDTSEAPDTPTGIASDVELAAHTGDTAGAHAASAISFTAGGTIAGTDVQTAVAEVATDAAAALTAALAGALTPTSVTATNDVESTTIGKGFVLKSPDGTRYRIKVADGGALSTEVVA